MTQWAFATVNGRLAEIYADKDGRFFGHCWVRRAEFPKRLWPMIRKDRARYRVSWRKGCYRPPGWPAP